MTIHKLQSALRHTFTSLYSLAVIAKQLYDFMKSVTVFTQLHGNKPAYCACSALKTGKLHRKPVQKKTRTQYRKEFFLFFDGLSFERSIVQLDDHVLQIVSKGINSWDNKNLQHITQKFRSSLFIVQESTTYLTISTSFNHTRELTPPKLPDYTLSMHSKRC